MNYYDYDSNTKEYTGEYLTARSEPDLTIFSTTELKVLAQIKEHFADMTASDITDLSHKEEGYQHTRDGELISYAHSLSISI